MRKLKKQLLRAIIACGLVVSVAAGSTVAYLTDTETATNTFTVGNVQIDLEEPGYPGNDSDEVKNIIPNQEIVKDPQIENTGNNDALAFLRVEVPQEMFTDEDDGTGEQKKQDLFRLKGVSSQWELLRTETVTGEDGKVKTSYVYGYKKTLGKGATTDKLFQKVQMKNAVESDLSGNVEDIVVTACAIQSTEVSDISLTPAEDGTLGKDTLDQVYTVFLNQSGENTPRPADEGNRSQTGKIGTITYELDGGSLTGALSGYGTADYGYTPPTPTKKGYTFAGWEPASIPANSTGEVTFTAKWSISTLGTISYHLDGGSITDEKTSYTIEDYGYVPTTPIKKGWKFVGWDPESIPVNNNGPIVFTAKWEEKVATLLDGETVNIRMKILAGSSSTRMASDWNIKAIQRSDEEPSELVRNSAHYLISTTDSESPIYMWFDNGVIKWWSEARHVMAGSDLSYLCCGLAKLSDISGLADIDTSNVTDMSRLFYVSYVPMTGVENPDASMPKFALDDITPLKTWDTKNVTDMSDMFYMRNQLTNLEPLANWDVSNVKNMRGMFLECSIINNASAINDWDVSNVINFKNMFGGCPSHPTFTKRAGTWDSNGTFTPTT